MVAVEDFQRTGDGHDRWQCATFARVDSQQPRASQGSGFRRRDGSSALFPPSTLCSRAQTTAMIEAGPRSSDATCVEGMMGARVPCVAVRGMTKGRAAPRPQRLPREAWVRLAGVLPSVDLWCRGTVATGKQRGGQRARVRTGGDERVRRDCARNVHAKRECRDQPAGGVMASGDASDPAHGGSAWGWLPIRSSRRGHSVGGPLAASLGDVGQEKGSDEESACPSFFSEEQPTPGSWGATKAPL